MGLFRRKQEQVGVPKDEPEEVKKEEKKEETSLGDSQLGVQLEKVKAQISSQQEMQKVAGERFTRVNEQIGELRAMILERDKSSKMLEAKALQAIDMVESVQPDTLMIEVRKMDGKIEALRASIEGNESIMKNIMAEIKEMRTLMSTFRGLDQVVKLSNDIKNDLMTMKKVSIDVERHADMVSSIFNESQKRFKDMERFVESTKELDKSFKQIISEFETIKAKMLTLATKKSFEGLVGKFNQFEKHAGNVMLILNKKFKAVQDQMKFEFDDRILKVESLAKGLGVMVRQTPELDKFFHMLDEKAKAALEKEAKEGEAVEQPGQEEDEDKGDEKEEGKEEKKE